MCKKQCIFLKRSTQACVLLGIHDELFTSDVKINAAIDHLKKL